MIWIKNHWITFFIFFLVIFSSFFYFSKQPKNIINKSLAQEPGQISLKILPSSTSVYIDQSFTIRVEVDSGSTNINSVRTFLNFDTNYLQVKGIIPGNTFNNITLNTINNAIGQVDFTANSSSSVSGRYTVFDLTFDTITPTTNTQIVFNAETGNRQTQILALPNTTNILNQTENAVVVIHEPFWKQGPLLPEASMLGKAFILNDKLYYLSNISQDSTQLLIFYSSLLNQTTGIPEKWTMEEQGPLRSEADGFYYNNKFYLVGGANDNGPVNNIYSFDGNLWNFEKDLPIQGVNNIAAALLGRQIFVAGGFKDGTYLNDIWAAGFNTNNTIGIWHKLSTPLPENMMTKMIANNDCMYIVGGLGDSYKNKVYSHRLFILEQGYSIGARHEEQSLPKGIYPNVVIRGNKLYVLGGQIETGIISNEVFSANIGPNCTLDAWITESPIPQRREFPAVASNNNSIYIIGGRAEDYSLMNSVWFNYQEGVLPTATPTVPNSTPTPTPTCVYTFGDANGDDKRTLSDFEIWREEFYNPELGSRADANCPRDGVTTFDFRIWKTNYPYIPMCQPTKGSIGTLCD